MMHPMHHYQFVCLLLLALVTSRMKMKLPGLTGNMSVNLPFLFLAIVRLNLLEAAVIAFASTLVQSLPKQNEPLRPIRVLFNVSTVTTAAGFAYMVLRDLSMSGVGHSAALLMSAGTYFLVNTLPVATIISLTEGAKVMRTWLGIAHLSFPYYVAGTGITSMITGASSSISWAAPLAVFPVMVGMYRSYRVYFEQRETAAAQQRGASSASLAKQKAAGAI